VFYKHTRLEKKLRENGRSAPAEILSMRTEGHTSSAKLSGDEDLTVPVLYDPGDHDKVVVDYEADARETMERLEQQRTAGKEFTRQATEFADQAAAFRQQSESMLGNSEKLAALARAKAAGNQDEVDRLKAEITKPD
jgi:hypothetical protein